MHLAWKILLGVFVVGAIGISMNTGKLPNAPDPHSVDAVTKNIKVENLAWESRAFGKLTVASFKLRNANAFAIKDVTLTCFFYGGSGTLVGQKTATITKSIDANATVAVVNYDFGAVDQQAAGAHCLPAYAQF